jgi:hypothetical protein
MATPMKRWWSTIRDELRLWSRIGMWEDRRMPLLIAGYLIALAMCIVGVLAAVAAVTELVTRLVVPG